MIHKLISICRESPDLRTFAIFDDTKLIYVSGDASAQIHDVFVAIQQLAENIGEALGAENLLHAKFSSTSDQFHFRSIVTDQGTLFAVFKAIPQVDLENLVDSLIKQAADDPIGEAEIEASSQPPPPESPPDPKPKKRTYRGVPY